MLHMWSVGLAPMVGHAESLFLRFGGGLYFSGNLCLRLAMVSWPTR